jgi:hypothetical protein
MQEIAQSLFRIRNEDQGRISIGTPFLAGSFLPKSAKYTGYRRERVRSPQTVTDRTFPHSSRIFNKQITASEKKKKNIAQTSELACLCLLMFTVWRVKVLWQRSIVQGVDRSAAATIVGPPKSIDVYRRLEEIGSPHGGNVLHHRG